MRNSQIQTCFFCACLFWAPNVADLKLRDLDCLLTFTESLRRSYEKDDDFFVIFLLGVSAISSKVWLPSSKQHLKKIKTQYYQAPTKLVWNGLQSYRKSSSLQGMEPTEEQFQFFQQVVKMKKADDPAMSLKSRQNSFLLYKLQQASAVMLIWKRSDYPAEHAKGEREVVPCTPTGCGSTPTGCGDEAEDFGFKASS